MDLFLVARNSIILVTYHNLKLDPSVNYAKDWLDQLFLIPGLEKGIIHGCHHYGAVNNHFPVYWAICLVTVTPNRTNNQLGDSRASLLLTSEKTVFCNFDHTDHKNAHIGPEITQDFKLL